MNIYDKAHELARALKESGEVMDYKKALDKINSNPSSKKMIDDLREKQFEIIQMQAKGVEPSKEQMDSINNLFNVISLNPEVRTFLEAEFKFSKTWEDIMNILGEAIGIKNDKELER